MRRSKMEIYIDILKALACHGRLKLTHIMYKANISCSALKESLDLLIQQDLVKERTLNKKRVVYTSPAHDDRGVTTLLHLFHNHTADLQFTL